tara:strand:+ start:1132 stop:1881 length:750 start_codon:yes stop_codon:yes gene_type:complete
MEEIVEVVEVELTKKGQPRKRKPKTKNNYFTEDTEEAILEYRRSTNQATRNKIYNQRIHHGFYKLAENIIHTFKFYYTEVDKIEDLKYEVVSFLLQKLDLYDQSKGKAYSYFGTIAKRYLIIYNQKNYKKLVNKIDIPNNEEDDESFKQAIIVKEYSEPDRGDIIERFSILLESKIPTLFEKQDEINVAYAILEIFKKRENIEIFNKKALFIYIKEMTDCQSNTITKVIKKIKGLYVQILNNYIENADY